MSSGMMLAIVLAKTLFYPAAKVAVDRLYQKPGQRVARGNIPFRFSVLRTAGLSRRFLQARYIRRRNRRFPMSMSGRSTASRSTYANMRVAQVHAAARVNETSSPPGQASRTRGWTRYAP
jgi:hypothetical protein